MFRHHPSLKHYAVVRFQKQPGEDAERFGEYLFMPPFHPGVDACSPPPPRRARHCSSAAAASPRSTVSSAPCWQGNRHRGLRGAGRAAASASAFATCASPRFAFAPLLKDPRPLPAPGCRHARAEQAGSDGKPRPLWGIPKTGGKSGFCQDSSSYYPSHLACAFAHAALSLAPPVSDGNASCGSQWP